MSGRFILVLFFLNSTLWVRAQVFKAPDYQIAGTSMTKIDDMPVPLPGIRKADIFWAKRVWRVIDLREKINEPFYFPADPQNGCESLISVLINAILADSLMAYSAVDDEFRTPLTKPELAALLQSRDTIRNRVDPFTGSALPDTIIVTPYDLSAVISFRIKEDWFFDVKRSVLDVRILGICPLREEYDRDGNFKGTRADFWVYFPDARRFLVRSTPFNRFNDAQRLSYDDIFMKRLFSSYVVKESNVYDRYIQSFLTGLDALLESERSENATFEFEHDLWEY